MSACRESSRRLIPHPRRARLIRRPMRFGRSVMARGRNSKATFLSEKIRRRSSRAEPEDEDDPARHGPRAGLAGLDYRAGFKMRTRTRITFEATQNRLCRDFGGFLVLVYQLILRSLREPLREKTPVGPSWKEFSRSATGRSASNRRPGEKIRPSGWQVIVKLDRALIFESVWPVKSRVFVGLRRREFQNRRSTASDPGKCG